jgi:DNA polymerase I
MKRLVLIDGHALLHRAYHAFPKTLTTRSGELVNAVYGFNRILLSTLKELEPDYLIVAVDLPGPNFRHKEFVGYQAQRPKTDNELINQIKRVYQTVEAFNIPIKSSQGFEADDVIGTLSEQAKIKGIETIIVTGDKDIMQLADENIKLFVPQRNSSSMKIYSPKEVKELLGIDPEQIIDYKALVGDPSDNYPGVSGIGPKTAVDLLKKYKSLDGIYKNLDKIKPIVVKKLEEGKESARLSFKLATIIKDVPVKLDLKKAKLKDYDPEKVKNLYEELSFRSLLKSLPGCEEEERKKTEQMSLI